MTTFRQLLAENDLTPWTAIIIANDAAEDDRYRERFARSDLVDKVISVADFIPGDQDEKLDIIDEMSLLLGDLSIAAQPDAGTQSPATRLAAVRAFQEKLQAVQTDDTVMARLRGNLAGLLEEQDPSLSTPFLRKQGSTVLDSRLHGNGDGVDSRLRGNGDRVDSRLRGNGDRVDSRLRGDGNGVDSRLPRGWRRGGFPACAGMVTGWIPACAGMATGWIPACAGMARKNWHNWNMLCWHPCPDAWMR